MSRIISLKPVVLMLIFGAVVWLAACAGGQEATPIPTETPTPIPPTSTPAPTLTSTAIPPTPTPVDTSAVSTPTPTPTVIPPAPTPEPTRTPLPTETRVRTKTPMPTVTPVPTQTPVRAETPIPTPTPVPTATPDPLGAEFFLEISSPEAELDEDIAFVSTSSVTIVGRTRVDAAVTIDDAFVEVDEEGRFEGTVDLEIGPNLIEVVASVTGEEGSVVLIVAYEPE